MTNPLVPELSTQCTLQNTGNLKDHLLLCWFLADDFRWCSVFSASHCKSTEVVFQHRRVKPIRNILQGLLRCILPNNWKSLFCFKYLSVHKSSLHFKLVQEVICWSQWPCSLRRGSSAARLLVSWVRIPQAAWMSVSCECCVLSGRGLCDGLVPRPEESYRVWCV
jgi:hypothetical protein